MTEQMKKIMLIMAAMSLSDKDIIKIEEGKIFKIDNLDEDKQFEYAGEPGEIKVGQIVKDIEHDIDVEILCEDEEGIVHVKWITYFYAKVTDGTTVYDICIGASDRTDAISILKKHASARGIKKMLSIKPVRSSFAPLISTTQH